MNSKELQPGNTILENQFIRVSLLYIIREKPAETNSAAQKAHHTPSAPSNLLSKKAAGMIYFFNAPVFPGTKIISHQRPDSLDDSVGSQADESLQLIIYAENEDIFV